MSDREDPGIPAFCESMELIRIDGACEDLDEACCARRPSSACEAAGGQCLAEPGGGGVPVDCEELGLLPSGAVCSDVDQTCCA